MVRFSDLGIEPGLIEVLAQQGIEEPFEVQTEAIPDAMLGKDICCRAPTGSGKTLVGEYAIYRAIAHGQKVFYTTPLKALSNQKLRDFRDQFGPEKVGGGSKLSGGGVQTSA